MKYLRVLCIVVGFVSVGLSPGCSEEEEPCVGPNGPCTEIRPGGDVQTRAQTALIEAQPGDIILFGKGTFEFQTGLSLDVDDVTIRGRGMSKTVLSFAGQTDGAEGLLVTSDNFTLEDIAIEDTAGDGIKVIGTTGVTFRRVRAEWTGGALSSNGAYGLYPVLCENVLVEDSIVRGASDAGIYIGQSRNIIVRNNLVEFNVAGIEIENSNDADVYGNVATRNTGGVLVFNLPGLQMSRGDRTRVFDNEIFDNNTDNFAPPGSIVGKVPRGTGFASVAAHNVELFGNDIRDNKTGNLAIISYLTTELDYDDPEYDPYSDSIYIHDNQFSGGGDEPTDELGFVIVQALVTIMPAEGLVVPDIVIDGWANPDLKVGGSLPAEYKICIRNNGDANFANLDRENNHENVTTSLAPHDCAHDPLPAAMIPGVE